MLNDKDLIKWISDKTVLFYRVLVTYHTIRDTNYWLEMSPIQKGHRLWGKLMSIDIIKNRCEPLSSSMRKVYIMAKDRADLIKGIKTGVLKPNTGQVYKWDDKNDMYRSVMLLPNGAEAIFKDYGQLTVMSEMKSYIPKILVKGFDTFIDPLIPDSIKER